MNHIKLTMRIILSILFLSVCYSLECTAEDGTVGVELWGKCYSIENTFSLYLDYNDLTGSIPSEIGNLTNLIHLDLNYNQLTGSIPSLYCGVCFWGHTPN